MFFCGESETLNSEHKLVHGAQGEVTGAGGDDNEVAVRFPGNEGDVGCRVTCLSRTWPANLLPGKLCVGDAVFSCVAAVTFEAGDTVEYGAKGVVTGPDEEAPDTSVRVSFAGNSMGPIGCCVQELSRSWPPPLLPDGLVVGDAVYYCGTSQAASNGDRWVHGTLIKYN